MLLLSLYLWAMVFQFGSGALGNPCDHSPCSISDSRAGVPVGVEVANSVESFSLLIVYVNGLRHELVSQTIRFREGKVVVYRLPVGISGDRVIDRWLEVMDGFMKGFEDKMQEYLGEGEEFRVHLRVCTTNDVQLLQPAYRVEVVVKMRLSGSSGLFPIYSDAVDGEATIATLFIGVIKNEVLVFEGLEKDQIEEFTKERKE